MILVFGSQHEPMIEQVCQELQRRGSQMLWLDHSHLPGTVRLHSDGQEFLEFKMDGRWVRLEAEAAVYHRLGFSKFQSQQDYSAREDQFVQQECLTLMQSYLNFHGGCVVNRPFRSGSNASKPFQASLLGEFGFRVPNTLVTNLPSAAATFYENMDGKVIYKSISYLRSIVQRMESADLDRLDTLSNCPIQLQEAVEGFDVRVHVIGDEVFPARILAEQSDYRYDKKAEVAAWDLPEPWADRCRELSRHLGLWLSGIDLRFTPEGEVVCFEANPSPAFTWYEARTEQPLTAALCSLLENPPAARL
ncbi:hypothetical protein JST97_23345 [bacterium]|nr:hypothetical protein [bacterium]